MTGFSPQYGQDSPATEAGLWPETVERVKPNLISMEPQIQPDYPHRPRQVVLKTAGDRYSLNNGTMEQN